MSVNLSPTMRAQLNVEHGAGLAPLEEFIGQFETITAKLTKKDAFVAVQEHVVKRGHDHKCAIIQRRVSPQHDAYLIAKINGMYRVEGPGVSFEDRSITRVRKICDLMAEENHTYEKEN